MVDSTISWIDHLARRRPVPDLDRIRLLMDRRLARKNIRSALIATAVCVFMFGASFLAAAIYIS
jgi:hypothetical protein